MQTDPNPRRLCLLRTSFSPRDVSAFCAARQVVTDDGIENLQNLIQIHKDAPWIIEERRQVLAAIVKPRSESPTRFSRYNWTNQPIGGLRRMRAWSRHRSCPSNQHSVAASFVSHGQTKTAPEGRSLFFASGGAQVRRKTGPPCFRR